MFKKAIRVTERVATEYNLKFQIRATDRLRNIDAELTPRAKLTQNVLEHEAMTAKIIAIIAEEYHEDLVAANIDIDVKTAAFDALFHDDGEWRKGDLVVTLEYGCTSQAEKDLEESEAIAIAHGKTGLIARTIADHRNQANDNALFSKMADILELFFHNRILISFKAGDVPRAKYKDFDPVTWQESESFIELYDLAGKRQTPNVAEILEYKYIIDASKRNWPPLFKEIFFEVAKVVQFFPFEKHIDINPTPTQNPPE